MNKPFTPLSPGRSMSPHMRGSQNPVFTRGLGRGSPYSMTSAPPWYHPNVVSHKAGQAWGATKKAASAFGNRVLSPEARVAGAMRWNVATTGIAPRNLGSGPEKLLYNASELATGIANPKTRGATLGNAGVGLADGVAKGATKAASALDLIPGARLARRHPGAAAAMMLFGGAAAATTGMGVSGANQAMTMNRMHTAHSAQQRQAIQQGVTPRGTRNQVQSTFSGQRVKGGHLGASGDLVFAMHNRR